MPDNTQSLRQSGEYTFLTNQIRDTSLPLCIQWRSGRFF